MKKLLFIGMILATFVACEKPVISKSSTEIEREIRVSQNKIPARLCETWSLPKGY